MLPTLILPIDSFVVAWVDVLADIGVAGAVDILVMSLLVYGALAWMQAHRMRRLVRGVVVVVVFYLAARQFELELTATTLEALLVVVAVSAVVLYGSEIRRLIERIAPFGAQHRKGPSTRQAALLTSVLFDMGAKRTGALVVIEGRDPVDALVEGGVELDGVVSEPLLRSIFDPSSMGHDGALVLRGERASRFACHLPLSSNHELLGHRGTRHAAALGLSEQSDALSIAVSEERGTVTLCAQGELDEIETALELEHRITAHTTTKPKGRRWALPLPKLRLSTLMLAFAVSMLTWLVMVHGGRPALRTYSVDLETSGTPAALALQAVHPRRVTVTVTGKGRDFYMVSDDKVRVSIPLDGLKAGQHAIPIVTAHVRLPRGLTLKSAEPNLISVSLVPR